MDPETLKLLCLAASMIQDLANGWPVRELAMDPEEWRGEARRHIEYLGVDDPFEDGPEV